MIDFSTITNGSKIDMSTIANELNTLGIKSDDLVELDASLVPIGLGTGSYDVVNLGCNPKETDAMWQRLNLLVQQVDGDGAPVGAPYHGVVNATPFIKGTGIRKGCAGRIKVSLETKEKTVYVTKNGKSVPVMNDDGTYKREPKSVEKYVLRKK